MSVSRSGKTASHPIQIQVAINSCNFPPASTFSREETKVQTPLNELLTDIENFSYEAMLPHMQKIQTHHNTKKR